MQNVAAATLVEAMLGGARRPVAPQQLEVNRLLASARLERRHPACPPAARAGLVEVGLHLTAALRELLERGARHAGDLRHALDWLVPGDPKRAAQLGPQLGLVEVT